MGLKNMENCINTAFIVLHLIMMNKGNFSLDCSANLAEQ